MMSVALERIRRFLFVPRVLCAVFTVFLFAGVLGLSALATAQQFSHVIIVIQENRSTDNLFGASGLPGADLALGPKAKARLLGDKPDLSHSHASFLKEAAGKWPNGAQNFVTDAQVYWNLAAQYGFANYMFQTNQGDSYPSHQFLVSATSAIADTSQVLVSAAATVGGEGCGSRGDSLVPTLAPDGTTGEIFPCFERSSLMTLLDAAGISWRYYAATGNPMWDAPLSLKNYSKSKNIVIGPAKVLKDIASGTLAQVTWLTPAASYSDHPGDGSGGPAWVASVVNAIGQSPYWPTTAILVTWDDWGGWWDHVKPLANNTGWCANFCYGFRLPLLVISPQTPQGYVDNGVHDFGSILHFVESNSGLGQIGPGGWADAYADDLSAFFVAGTNRQFVKVNARKLTKKELADRREPDSN